MKLKRPWLNPRTTWWSTMTREGHQPWSTNLETGCTWMPATSTPPGLLRNSLTGDLAPSRLSGKLETAHIAFVSLLLWVDFCYKCPLSSFSFSFLLLQTHRTLSLLFPFPLCHPWTSICLPFCLMASIFRYDSLWLIQWVILILRTHSMSHSYI